MSRSRHISVCILAATILAGCGGPTLERLTVFHAHSVSIPMREAAADFEARHPEVRIQLEPGGSLDSARKLTDLARRCDVFVSADVDVIRDLLMPAHAAWYLAFATNDVVLAYRPGLAEAPTRDNWTERLLDPNAKFGRSDPNAEPIGYRTIFVLKLAESFYDQPGLAEALLAKDAQHVRPNPAALMALIETGAIDFALVYRNMAVQSGLPFIELPAEINLGHLEHAARYASVQVDVAGARPGETITVEGAAVSYAMTIPTNASNPKRAEAFIAYLLTDGIAHFERNHLRTAVPAQTPDVDALPEPLKPLARPAP